MKYILLLLLPMMVQLQTPTPVPDTAGHQAGDVVVDSSGIEQVWVPAGCFLMGTSDEQAQAVKDAKPPTWVIRELFSELVVSWGSTFGAARSAVERAQDAGLKVAHTHLRHLNPLPRDLENILDRYQTILVPELNLGQLAHYLRGTFGMNNIVSFPKVKGRPFTVNEIYRRIYDEVVVAGGGALDRR